MKILVATQFFYLISTYMLRNETIFPLWMFGVSMYNQFLELCRHLAIVLLQIQFVTKPEFFLRIRPHLTKLWQKLQCLGFFGSQCIFRSCKNILIWLCLYNLLSLSNPQFDSFVILCQMTSPYNNMTNASLQCVAYGRRLEIDLYRIYS